MLAVHSKLVPLSRHSLESVFPFFLKPFCLEVLSAQPSDFSSCLVQQQLLDCAGLHPSTFAVVSWAFYVEALSVNPRLRVDFTK